MTKSHVKFIVHDTLIQIAFSIALSHIKSTSQYESIVPCLLHRRLNQYQYAHLLNEFADYTITIPRSA